jgi:N-acetylglucosamine-6-phosphate deacetylase
MNTKIINAIIFNGKTIEYNAAIGIVNGKFTADTSLTYDEVIDFENDWLVPGFIDLQIYGGNGKLFSDDPSITSLQSLYAYSLAGGATSVLPTIATNSPEIIFKAIAAVKAYQQQKLPGILGLHLEGPFINPIKKGAHLEQYIVKSTLEFAQQITDAAEGLIKIITLAPECCDDKVIAHFIKEGIQLSAGHSNASFEEAIDAFKKGIKLSTHLFNAMSPLNHREPGLPGAVFLNDEVCSSIVPDGYHVSFDMIKIVKKLMGDRLFIITDAVTATKGIYPHQLYDDRYVLPDGTLSGSALTMLKGVINCIEKVDIAPEEAFRMASLYAAKAINADKYLGKIKEGYTADYLRLSDTLELKAVFKNTFLQ